MTIDTIGKKLKELREDKSLKQVDVAKLLKISSVAYGRYENNQRSIPIESLVVLADYYKISLDYLCDRINY